MTQKSQQATVSAQQAGRIDRVVQKLTGQSRRALRGLFDKGCVSVNGKPCRETFFRVVGGDVVGVNYDPHTRYREKTRPWKDPAFRIVYEDDTLLVVDKAAHVLTVPTGDSPSDTLVDRLQEYLTRAGRRDRAHVVHRLDRGVSGLLVVAKSDQAAQAIKEQFAAHKPERRYLAIVAGILEKKQGTFRSYLATGADLSRYSTRNTEKGELAVTHYRLLGEALGASLVEARLETGKRNQIRVHFAEAGHPVLGDPRYRKEHSQHPNWTARRLALHARSLELEHPVTGKTMSFEAAIPAPFMPFVRSIHADAKRPRDTGRQGDGQTNRGVKR